MATPFVSALHSFGASLDNPSWNPSIQRSPSTLSCPVMQHPIPSQPFECPQTHAAPPSSPSSEKADRSNRNRSTDLSPMQFQVVDFQTIDSR